METGTAPGSLKGKAVESDHEPLAPAPAARLPRKWLALVVGEEVGSWGGGLAGGYLGYKVGRAIGGDVGTDVDHGIHDVEHAF